MEKLKVSKGDWNYDINANKGFDVFVNGTFKTICTVLTKDVSYMPTEEEAISNAKLITDAGTTYNKCELLPSELLEQRDALLKALEVVALCSNYEEAKRHGVNSGTHWTTLVAETLKKIK